VCDETLWWRPDKSSVGRGARELRWPVSGVVVLSGRRRRDISGLPYHDLTVVLSAGEPVRRIGVFLPVGNPDPFAGPGVVS
jgi:hypothetical protein